MIPVKDNIPNERFPLVTVALILANLVVYVLAAAHGGSLIAGPATRELVRYGTTPAALTHGRRLGTILSAMFLHASIVALAANMLFLWIFGNTIEDAMGSLRFLAFYLTGGVAALALQTAVAPRSASATVGAAGAIAAVLGAYIVIYPRARVLTLSLIVLFFTVVETPAVVMLALWVAVQAVLAAAGLTDPGGGGGAAVYLVYAGGFAFGLASVRPLATRRKSTPPTAAAYR